MGWSYRAHSARYGSDAKRQSRHATGRPGRLRPCAATCGGSGGAKHPPHSAGLPFGVLCLAACSASPAQDLAGSFFPAWMLCAALGVAATVAAHILLVAIRLDKHVLMPPLAYLSIAAAVTLFTWLSWFGQ